MAPLKSSSDCLKLVIWPWTVINEPLTYLSLLPLQAFQLWNFYRCCVSSTRTPIPPEHWRKSLLCMSYFYLTITNYIKREKGGRGGPGFPPFCFPKCPPILIPMHQQGSLLFPPCGGGGDWQVCTCVCMGAWKDLRRVKDVEGSRMSSVILL